MASLDFDTFSIFCSTDKVDNMASPQRISAYLLFCQSNEVGNR